MVKFYAMRLNRKAGEESLSKYPKRFHQEVKAYFDEHFKESFVEKYGLDTYKKVIDVK